MLQISVGNCCFDDDYEYTCDCKGEDAKAKARVSPIKPSLEAGQVAGVELRGVAARQQQLEGQLKLLVLVLVVAMVLTLVMVITEWPGGDKGVNKLQEGGADL